MLRGEWSGISSIISEADIWAILDLAQIPILYTYSWKIPSSDQNIVPLTPYLLDISEFTYLSWLINQFSRHMFRRKLQTLNSWKCILKFFLQILCIISKLPGQRCTYISCLIFIFNKADPAKQNDTFYIKSPIAFLPIALVIYTVTGFIAGFYRVDLIIIYL